MATWQQYDIMQNGENIRLDTLDLSGKTAGWVVRRSCNVYQAFRPTRYRPESGVVDLLQDGFLVGIFPNGDDAQRAVLDELGIRGPVEYRDAGGVVYLSVKRPTLHAV